MSSEKHPPTPGMGAVEMESPIADLAEMSSLAGAEGETNENAPDNSAESLILTALTEEVANLKDRLLRSAAEMENLRKRSEREKAEATLYAATNFARDLLAVADSLSRALEAVPPEERIRSGEIERNFIGGIEVTERELHNVFQRHGIRKLETIGQKFDPNYHQAMFEVPTSAEPPGIVMQEIQLGYAVGERCLRPALVGVSKAE